MWYVTQDIHILIAPDHVKAHQNHLNYIRQLSKRLSQIWWFSVYQFQLG